MPQRPSMVQAMQLQLEVSPHLNGQEHDADRELLLVMAEGIDAARESVAGGSAALPLINACRYLFETVRKVTPKPLEDNTSDAFDEAMAWED